MAKRDFRTVMDFSRDEMMNIFALTAKIKENPQAYSQALAGKSLAMINEKQSLRTKVTFLAGAQQLGGHSVYLTNQDISLGKREPVKDVARNLARWVDIIVARVFQQSSITELAKYADIPVINALSDEEHPCQVVADVYTLWDQLRKRENMDDFHLTFVGDGNNVCNSLILISALVGMRITVCTPPGYEPDPRIVRQGRELAHANGGAVTFEVDPRKAVNETDAIYTDVWTSMGQEAESEKRLQDFKMYQVNEDLLSWSTGDVVIMHCLPAHRGEEITDEVLESKHSLVFDQAENRLHAQKAIMKFLLDASS
ncbi:ornithine carbamoyltransferase [bacterium]|nr:ornithine carbamoyltransferase [bacterium]